MRIRGLFMQEEKGVPYLEKTGLALETGKGIRGDRHYGKGRNQVCILDNSVREWIRSEQEGLCLARFHENILTEGISVKDLLPGDRLEAGEVILKITEAGKECFAECPRVRGKLDCLLRKGCCFAEVEKGGLLKKEDEIRVLPREEGLQRYQRQMNLPGLGEEGLRKLLRANVLVIGAGGLGTPAITCLSEAGVGGIGIADGDVVELSNLNRQFFYAPDVLGKGKAALAAGWVRRFRPDCRVRTFGRLETEEMVEAVCRDYDMVVLAVDSIETRFMVNRVCVRMGKPLVDGAIGGFYGTIQAVLKKGDPCLACVNPEQKKPAGTSVSFAPVTMMTGAFEARIAIGWLAGFSDMGGRLFSLDCLSGTLEEIPISVNPHCEVCKK